MLVTPEGAPAILRRRIAAGRAAVLDQLAEAVGPGLVPGRESPDPELTARILSAVADELARLLLTDSRRYPVERMVDHARWLLEQLPSRRRGSPRR